MNPQDASSHRYMPALDGLRAFAVAAVIAFHLGASHVAFSHFTGGFLGVDVFFVLSGFLITGLLVSERRDRGGIRLGAFWGRRARRLLAAVCVLLITLSVYIWAGGQGIVVEQFRGDAVATLFYFANWHFLFTQQPYFGKFIVLSPLMHTWSLAVEEQFYLLWPLIMVLLLRGRRRGRHADSQRPFSGLIGRALLATLVLAIASAVEMALLYHGGTSQDRVYYGTDTRAFELMGGAALALFFARRGQLGQWPRRVLHGSALLAAGGLAYMATAATDSSPWMYRGGFEIVVVLSVIVIASISQVSSGPLGWVLSIRPIRWLGAVSYGLYLWHWPVIDLVNNGSTGLSGAQLLLAQLALMLAVTAVSFYLIERPIRRARYRTWPRLTVAPVGVAATATVILLGTVPLAAASAAAPTSLSGASPTATSVTAPPAVPADPPGAASAGGDTPGPPSALSTISLPPGRVPTRYSPLRVMILGDSVIHDAEPGLAAALDATGVVRVMDTSFPGFGLTTQSESWRTTWPRDISEFHPEVVMGTWSWDIADAAANPDGYASLMDQAMATLLSPGDGVDGVVLLDFPRTGPVMAQQDVALRIAAAHRQEAGREAWNAVAAGMAQVWPGRVSFLQASAALEVNGHFSTWLPELGSAWVRARKIDNAHICPAGAVAWGTAIVDYLAQALHLPSPSPGWWSGPWVHDPRFDQPLGACPDDQPPPGYTAQLAPGAPPTTQFH